VRCNEIRAAYQSRCAECGIDALSAAGVVRENIYEDRASGAKDDRPGLSACLKALRKGDTLIIWKLDRLGRDLKHLIAVVEELSGRGVGLKVLQGAPVDTTTSNGKLMFQIFAALAEFERSLIRERTIAGLQAARARGRKGGRKSAFTKSKLRRAQAALANRDQGVTELCEELGVSKSTLYRHVGPDGKLTVYGEKLLAAPNGNGR
jgi:DNA invertase Pin-like site-specific DNA recombinase